MYKGILMVFCLITRCLSSFQRCAEDNLVVISNGVHLPNGEVHFNGLTFLRGDYYVDNETGLEKGCVCRRNDCLRKCCPLGSGYDFTKKVCVNITTAFAPPVWDDYRVLKNVDAAKDFYFLIGKQNCSLAEYRVRASQVGPRHHLRRDGKLYMELPSSIPPWTVRGPEKYCIDTFVYPNDDGTVTTKLDALVCFEETVVDTTGMIVSSTCMLISCVFILATVAVYAWLPELRNLHGRVLMAYLLCLFVGFLFLATMQILLIVNNIPPEMCVAFTFVIYFFLESAFFWLNIMSFDIWWTFRFCGDDEERPIHILCECPALHHNRYHLGGHEVSLDTIRTVLPTNLVRFMIELGLDEVLGKRGMSLEKLSTRARFCAYAAYAFGVPSVLTIVMACLEFSGLPAHPLLPNIKRQGCFIFGMSKLLYLYGPIIVLCVANMIFFVLTALKIAQIRKQTSVLKSKESTTHDQTRNDQQRLLLYVKLFAVMGINWLLEVISGVYPDAIWLFQYTDAYNVLIGLIIFIIFVCKRKIFMLMKKRYMYLRGYPMSRTATASSRTNSSRDDIRMNSIKNNA